jgi:hypothetical protein
MKFYGWLDPVITFTASCPPCPTCQGRKQVKKCKLCPDCKGTGNKDFLKTDFA